MNDAGLQESIADSPQNREVLREVLSEVNALGIEDGIARALRSHVAGKMVRQLTFWEGKSAADDFWIWKSGPEWWEEAGLSRSNLKTGISKLENVGLLEVDRNRVRPTDRRPCTFYRLNLFAVLRLVDPVKASGLEPELEHLEESVDELATDSYQPSTTLTQCVENQHTNTPLSSTLACQKVAGEHVRFTQSRVSKPDVPQENTQASTQEKTQGENYQEIYSLQEFENPLNSADFPKTRSEPILDLSEKEKNERAAILRAASEMLRRDKFTPPDEIQFVLARSGFGEENVSRWLPDILREIQRTAA